MKSCLKFTQTLELDVPGLHICQINPYILFTLIIGSSISSTAPEAFSYKSFQQQDVSINLRCDVSTQKARDRVGEKIFWV